VTPLAICFDATGTLIETTEPVGAVYRRIALAFGVDLPAWRLDDAFRRVLRHAPPRGIAGASREARRAGELAWWSDRVRQTFQATDSTVSFEDFAGFADALFDAYRQPEAWRARPGVVEALTALRRGEARMAVVSNFDHRLPEILESLGLKQFFDLIEIPFEHGRLKPDRAIFEDIARLFERPIDGLVYVGDDDPATLDAIRRLGIAVLDVGAIGDLATLPDLLCTNAIVRPPEARPPST
jgi:putative hydrolase of the HAD superfamily